MCHPNTKEWVVLNVMYVAYYNVICGFCQHMGSLNQPISAAFRRRNVTLISMMLKVQSVLCACKGHSSVIKALPSYTYFPVSILVNVKLNKSEDQSHYSFSTFVEKSWWNENFHKSTHTISTYVMYSCTKTVHVKWDHDIAFKCGPLLLCNV